MSGKMSGRSGNKYFQRAWPPCKESLAHCVSADLKMGAGIAKQFRNRFGRVEELKRQHKKVGEVAVLRVRDRFIYYLITKKFYYKKPTLFTLKRSLE